MTQKNFLKIISYFHIDAVSPKSVFCFLREFTLQSLRIMPIYPIIYELKMGSVTAKIILVKLYPRNGHSIALGVATLFLNFSPTNLHIWFHNTGPCWLDRCRLICYEYSPIGLCSQHGVQGTIIVNELLLIAPNFPRNILRTDPRETKYVSWSFVHLLDIHRNNKEWEFKVKYVMCLPRGEK